MLGIKRQTLIASAILLLAVTALPAAAVDNAITGVNVVPADGKVRIEIAKAGNVTFNAFTIGEPDRLVINCVGAKYAVPWQSKDVQSAVVKRVRASQYELDPLVISRVVVDLAGNVDFKMWAEGETEIVELAPRAGDATQIRAQAAPSQAAKPAPQREKSATLDQSPLMAQASMGPFLPFVPGLGSAEAPAAPAKAEPAGPIPEPAKTAPVTVVAPEPAKAAPAQAEPAKAASAPQPAQPKPAPAAETKSAAALPQPLPIEASMPFLSPVPAAPVSAQPAQAAAAAPAKSEAAPSPWVSMAEPKAAATEDKTNFYATDDAAYSPAEETKSASSWNDRYARGNPAAGSGRATGSNRITIDAQGADIKTVLRTISDYSGKNIVYGPDVKGEVFVHIKNVPWEEALDILLHANGYGYREEYGMIRVSELSKLTKEELELQGAERKKDDLLPLQTRIIFVNNAKAEELKTALQNIVSQRGKLDIDKGSNSLIVSDTEPVIDKIAEMVKTLDRKTFQVDINAKLVDVDVEATREMGIDWGLLNLHASGVSAMGSAAVSNPIASSAGTVKFGTVRSWGELNAMLQMLERSNKANIISNPHITTMDNREASILVGKEIPLIVADEAGNPITELTKIGIMLKVTPHVNADKTITLDMHPEVSDLQSEATAQGGIIISTNEADTRVVVKNGETAAIGGLIKNSETSVKRGVPILKDVPILGWLFRSSNKADKKQELMIFVTPTIVE